MIDAPFAVALAAGVIAAFNPCGFAMLPAYVSYFVGIDPTGSESNRLSRIARAILVALAVTAGFMVVFGTIGVLINEARVRVYEYVPWVTGVIAVLLVVLGMAMAFGYEPKVALPKLGGAARQSNSLWSMVAYGVSYATVSLSCTLPTFIALTATSFDDRSVISGVAVYVTYAFGMGAVLLLVSVAVAMAQQAFVSGLRKILRFVNRASGVLLVLTGAYLLWYAWYEYRTVRGDAVAEGPVAWVTDASARVSNWVQGLDTAVLAAGVAAIVFSAVAVLGINRLRGPKPLLEHPLPQQEKAGS